MNIPTPDVARQATEHVTDFGDVLRIDLNQLGAPVPQTPADQEREAWALAQNEALCAHMETVARRHAGDFRSFVEWTVLNGTSYDGSSMRTVRRRMFGDGYRASITTLGWFRCDRYSARIQCVGYVPKAGAAGRFRQEIWRPAALYDTEFMGLAPATVTTFDGAKQIFLSGVVAWDDDIRPLQTDDPRRQVRMVLERIGAVFEEAHGSRHDVLRLRPFAHSPQIAAIIRDEAGRFWAGGPAPAIMLAESQSFGTPPQLYTEIQAMGVVPDRGGTVTQDEITLPAGGDRQTALRVRRAATRRWALAEVAEIRSEPGTAAAQCDMICAQAQAALQALAALGTDVCLAFCYVSGEAVARELPAALQRVVAPQSIHLVPTPPMAELDGGEVKLQMTVRTLAGER